AVDSIFSLDVHLPYIVAPIGLAECSGKNIPIHNPSDVPGQTITPFLSIETYRMIFIKRLAVQYGFYWCQLVVVADVKVRWFGTMAGLVHIEIQPFIFVKPGGRSPQIPGLGVKTHQCVFIATASFRYSFCHTPPDIHIAAILTG